jgi:hypothetical protein
MRRKEAIEIDLKILEEKVNEVANWGDLYGYRLLMQKLHEYKAMMDEKEQILKVIS